MDKTQYLIFEIGTECNLGALHPKCPNRNPERYSALPSIVPTFDADILAIAKTMYRHLGFRGRIGWHYYNEPLCSAKRMWHLMDRIDAEVPEARYTLWTNGTLLPEDCSQFARFEEIHVTDYGIPEHPVRNIAALVAAQHKTQIQRVRLDDRLHAIGDVHSEEPCHRMFTEFIIDYWGNVRLCCYDWQGVGSIRNVHDWEIGRIVSAYQETRRMAARLPGRSRVMRACDFCKMQSTHIPQFVPEIAADAKRYIESGR